MLWFYNKDETTNYNANITNNNDFKSFVYKAKLLGNTIPRPDPNANNGVLEIALITVPLKCLINFWRFLEIPVINWNDELKST